MQKLKDLSPPPSPTTTIFTQNSSHKCRPSPLTKRFNRSNSASRSKSKDEFKSYNPYPPFYVKNICQEVLSNKISTANIINNIEQTSTTKSSQIKRQSTPAKQRLLVNERNNSDLKNNVHIEKQLEILKIQKELRKMTKHNQQLIKMNQELQIKVKRLNEQLDDKNNEIRQISNKIKQIEQKGKQKHINSNLSKLKSAINYQRESEHLESVQSLQQKNRQLKLDNIQLQRKLKNVEKKYQQHKSCVQEVAEQKDPELNNLVQRLRIEISEKDEVIQKMSIQLNIHQVREVKKNQKKEAEKTGQTDQLKKKYGRLLTMYHEVNQQLTAYKSKSERVNYFLSSASKTHDRSIDSLSLSPDCNI